MVNILLHPKMVICWKPWYLRYAHTAAAEYSLYTPQYLTISKELIPRGYGNASSNHDSRRQQRQIKE